MPKLKYQREIGEAVDTFGRNLVIIDREIRPKIAYKHGEPYNLNQKFYKYRCLDCGNEDWIVEYSLGEHMHCGCNACCHPPKKVVVGVNDISTTAPWMIKYFPNGTKDAQKYTKYSKDRIDFVCPDCGRIVHKSVNNVCSAKTISCACGDGISYPNKYMYALLEQLKISFQPEKSFNWSNSKRYDFYVEHNGLKIIIEMHGRQHYTRCMPHSGRTLIDEQENDLYKEKIANSNGIDSYYQINASKSDGEYIKNSIIESGLLDDLNILCNDIDWEKCEKFATGNFIKQFCEYLSMHKDMSLVDMADIFNISVTTATKYEKIGRKYGWSNYDRKITVKEKSIQGKIDHRQKPIYCLTNDKYYRSASEISNTLSTDERTFYSRQIRKSIQRNQKYLGYKFIYITREEFNNAKAHYPDKTVGSLFLQQKE